MNTRPVVQATLLAAVSFATIAITGCGPEEEPYKASPP